MRWSEYDVRQHFLTDLAMRRQPDLTFIPIIVDLKPLGSLACLCYYSLIDDPLVLEIIKFVYAMNSFELVV